MARPTGRPVRDEILTEARTLVQRGGVSGFSYADVAERLGIRAPSIHHHFSRKDDLVEAVAGDYVERFDERTEAIADTTPARALAGYTELFAAPEVDGVLCLCGAVASDWAEVSPATRDQVRAFFERQLEWLEDQLRVGVDTGTFRSDLDVPATAVLLLSALEGALMLARTEVVNDVVRSVAASVDALIRA